MILHQQLHDRTLILASGSPRRHELMRQADLQFIRGASYDVDETYPDDLPAQQVPAYLALKKSEAYPEPLTADQVLITADTIVILNGTVVGKPCDREDAIRMITRMSGTSHEVVTGVAIRTTKRTIQFDSKSSVWLRKLDPEEIRYYVDTYSPMDKAGAYGIQEWIGCTAIERIEGSFYNVMGLPIQQLYQELKKLVKNR